MKKILLSLLIFVVVAGVYAVTPNPGHDAEEIGSGIFPGPGSYIYNNIVDVNAGFSADSITSTNDIVTTAGDISYAGTLNKLDVEENMAAIIRAADLKMGHSTRRGTPGRAIVDQSNWLYFNYGGDWATGSVFEGPRVYIQGKLGIGTNNPAEEIDVVGNIKASGTVCDGSGNCLDAVGGGGWIDDGAVVRLETSTDSVGVGTRTPGSKLDVNGSFRVSDPDTDMYLELDNFATPLRNFTTFGAYHSDEFYFGQDIIMASGKGFGTYADDIRLLVDAMGTSKPVYMVLDYPTGHMGLGTESPAYRLDVKGASIANNQNQDVARFTAGNAGSEGVSVLLGHADGKHARIRTTDAGSYGGNLHFDVNDDPGAANGENWEEVMTLFEDQRVGIRHNYAPDGGVHLQLNGTMRLKDDYRKSTTISPDGRIYTYSYGEDTFFQPSAWSTNYAKFGYSGGAYIDSTTVGPAPSPIIFKQVGSEIARFDTSGNLGIGDSTPDVKLDVAGDIHATGDVCEGSGICLSTVSGGGGGGWIDNGATVRLETSSDRVGIGTNTPNAKLHVVGDIDVSGVIKSESGNVVIQLG